MANGKKRYMEYLPVPICQVTPDEALCTDVYLKISGKFVKFKNKNDIIPGEKYIYFVSKKLKDFYIKHTDMKDFKKWIELNRTKNIREMVDEVGAEYQEVVEKREGIKEKIYEIFLEEEINPITVEFLQGQVSEFIDMASSKSMPKDILAKMLRYNKSIADHSVNVANLAVYIAMLAGHAHQFVLENVYLGGLFHDYGKVKIPEEVLNNVDSAQYRKRIGEHPRVGAQMVGEIKDISPQVVNIVWQHHEMYNGKGYPKKLKGDAIDELAKIVAIANHFDHVCSECQFKSNRDKFTRAIKIVEKNTGFPFDPKIVGVILEGLKLAYLSE